MGWLGRIVKLGAVLGLTSVILVMLLGQAHGRAMLLAFANEVIPQSVRNVSYGSSSAVMPYRS